MDYSNLVYFPEEKIKKERDCGEKYSTMFLSKEIAKQMSSFDKEFKEGEKIILCESERCPYNCQGEEMFSAESDSGLVSICELKKNLLKREPN